MYRLLDKTLATGRDVPSDFLRSKGAHNLKSLVGGDPISAEAKGKNDCYNFNGEINVVITSNSTLTIDLDADNKAWERRMLWINYNCEPVKDKIDNFADVLLKEEGSGILNWALEGARKLLMNDGQIPRSEEHVRRIRELLLESDSVHAFVETQVVEDPMGRVTSEQLYAAYWQFCRTQDW